MVSGESKRQSSPVQASNKTGVGNDKAPAEGYTVTHVEEYQETGGPMRQPFWRLYVVSSCY